MKPSNNPDLDTAIGGRANLEDRPQVVLIIPEMADDKNHHLEMMKMRMRWINEDNESLKLRNSLLTALVDRLETQVEDLQNEILGLRKETCLHK